MGTEEKKPLSLDSTLAVEVLAVKPNPLFSKFQNETTKFLRFNRAVRCAYCGKRRKLMWTSLISFQAVDVSQFVAQPSGPVLAPLTAVCSQHPIAYAEWPEEEKLKRAGK
jgi:hypothetical protein